MSGVFGAAAPIPSNHDRSADGIVSLLDKMAAAMSHREWFVTDRFADGTNPVGLGRIGIGIFNQAPQPIWNASRSIALVMAGEFYNQAEVGQIIPQAGDSDEELALALYERFGPDFACQLNGAFIIAIWDKLRHQLLITNDRFGLYPLFYAYRHGRLIFAPEMKGVLCDQTFPKKLDLTALGQYMRFQHLLGERTFFEDIQLLPNASVLIYDLAEATCRITPYWSFAQIPYRPQVTFGEAVEEAGRLLRQAVQRLTGDTYRPGVFLSGGLDSRSILGLTTRRPIVSLTYGRSDCRDVYYAERIARAAGSDHHWFDLPDGQWVTEQAAFHLELTEGYHSWIHAHGMSILPQARQLMEVNLTGWDGGTVMGHNDSIEPLQLQAVDESALLTRLFCLFNQNYTWPSLTEAEENLLYCPATGKYLQRRAFDSFQVELSPYLALRPDVRGEYFYIRNHCSRLTHNFITFTRSHIEVRFPFFDYDLFDFLYSLPAPVRGHKTLYRALIQHEMPRLASIPYDRDELPPTSQPLTRGLYSLRNKLKHHFNRRLWPAFTEHYTLYADYEIYLRHELRTWAEAILFDPRIAERGIFNPDFLRTLMNRHLSGLEEWTIGKIAPIITYELMLRRYYD